tara:strand:- start:91 stop:468 length:378 start_codon:yes stop_codon:yes gene_type:complete
MEKNNSSYKTISEVAKMLNLINNKTGKINTHTLRFWEKQFKQIKPIILSGKRRYYDNKSIDLLKKIKYLLKEKGMTINGVKKILINKSSFALDELANNSIKADKSKLKSKINRISELLKEIKKLK